MSISSRTPPTVERAGRGRARQKKLGHTFLSSSGSKHNYHNHPSSILFTMTKRIPNQPRPFLTIQRLTKDRGYLQWQMPKAFSKKERGSDNTYWRWWKVKEKAFTFLLLYFSYWSEETKMVIITFWHQGQRPFWDQVWLLASVVNGHQGWPTSATTALTFFIWVNFLSFFFDTGRRRLWVCCVCR